jgi:hypothetical protein
MTPSKISRKTGTGTGIYMIDELMSPKRAYDLHEQTIPCRFLADTSDTAELLHELRICEYVMRVLVVRARLCFD